MNTALALAEKVVVEFRTATDRAAAIVGRAFLEAVLRDVLLHFLTVDTTSDKSLFSGNGPLSAYSARITLSYRLGLVSQAEYRWLNVIRRIGNLFAHELELDSFNNQSIRDICSTICLPGHLIIPMSMLSLRGVPTATAPFVRAAENDPRGQFEELVVTLVHVLSARSSLAVTTRRVAALDFSSAADAFKVMLNLAKAQAKILEQQFAALEQLGQRPDRAIQVKSNKIIEEHSRIVELLKSISYPPSL